MAHRSASTSCSAIARTLAPLLLLLGALAAGAGPAWAQPIDAEPRRAALAIEPSQSPSPDGAAPLLPAPSAAAQAPERESKPLGMPRENTFLDRSTVQKSSSAAWWSQTALALAVVIGLIFLIKALLQRAAGRSGTLGAALGVGGRAPSGVLEVLGRYPVSRGQSLVLLRMDRRVLLLSQSSDGFRNLCEVTDPDEVASLVMKTRDEEGANNAAKFNDLLHRMERDPSVVDEEAPAESPLRKRLLGLRGVRA